ncbi:MAG: ankyrin repeat domain-containing protein, partial [Verrucomicrobiae bacterium]|nr:ankyrin repeat domain-containing protein [Verrucomicrobiae bacterium]
MTQIKFWSVFLSLGVLFSAQVEAATLAEAIEKQEMFQVEAILTKDVDVNEAQVDGMTPLHWAVYHDDAKLVKRLIDLGANATAANRYGITPLYLACQNGSADAIRLLLEAGADPDSAINGGETALMTAARTGKVNAVEVLIEAGANVDALERNDQTAIMWAAAEGHVDVVAALLNAGADFLTPLDSGWTPFFFAVREGHVEVVHLLIKAGADLNEAMSVEKKSGNRSPMNGTSALILAIENGHYDLAVDLLDAGADPNDMRTGYSPLHTLTWIRKPDIGESASGAPPPQGSGRRNSVQFIRELVRRGADVNIQLVRGRRAGGAHYSNIGATPFFLAADRADLEYMKLLVELGADPFISNEDNTTALLVAAGIGSQAPEEEAGSPEECRDAVAYLLSLGLDINAVDKNGQTAMHG